MNVDFTVYRVESASGILLLMKTTNDDKNAVTTWALDPVHTTVGFAVRHMMVTTMRGTFHKATGRVSYDAKDPGATAIEAQIPTASVYTREPQRDAHLRSSEFFDAEAHPVIVFRSTSARVGAGGALEVVGALMIRGITREVTLAVENISGEQRDHNGATRMGASATTRIKRSEFGMTYNKLLEAGGVALADEVSLTLDVALVKDVAH